VTVCRHEKYAGEKNLITFEGDHNSVRPDFFYDSAYLFFRNVLLSPEEKIEHGNTNLDFFHSFSSDKKFENMTQHEFYFHNHPVPSMEE
jgi:hypothetical protein